MMAEVIKPIIAIKRFFETGKHGKPCSLDELKALSAEDRKELAPLCAEALGVILERTRKEAR